MKIGIGLYGNNGHQIAHLLENRTDAEVIAVAEIDPDVLPASLRMNKKLKLYSTLEEMLTDDRVKLVSLCSPRRKNQAADAIRCLEAGRHVYAEKPCAMMEDDLDTIMEVSFRTGFKFHEMAGTAFEQPYISMRKYIQDGAIGEVVQVFVQKSYPYHDHRPQDNDIDGGLIMQVGIHAMRFIEHVAGQKAMCVNAIETKLGNPIKSGNLHMAASCIIELENGGIATIIANYLNPRGFGSWGNEHLRIFGTKGFIEAVDGGTRTRLIVGEKDYGPFQKVEEERDYFDYVMDELQGRAKMPLSLEDELHPTRMVIKANTSKAK